MRVARLAQQGPAWLAWRRAGLGASDAPAVCGVSPWCSPRQLWERRTGRAPEQEVTFAMRRGLRLEPVVRRLHAEATGVLTAPCCVEHDRRRYLRCSLDGLSLDGAVVLEVKCPNTDSHKAALAGQVPAYYLPQVMMQLYLTGARCCHYASFSEHRMFGAGERLALVEVLADPLYFAALEWALSCFWLAVRLDYWPDGGCPIPTLPPVTMRSLQPRGAPCPETPQAPAAATA